MLWLVRHATPIVACGVCYGRLDVAAEPRANAHAAAALALQLPPDIVGYYSPLQRCTQLAHAVQALRPDVVLQADPQLMEFDFGAWEGQRWDAIAQASYDAWVADFAHYRPGGGESLYAMLQRVACAWQHAQAQGRAQVWITHAGVSRCVQWLLHARDGALPSASQWSQWCDRAPACGAWAQYPLMPAPKR